MSNENVNKINMQDAENIVLSEYPNRRIKGVVEKDNCYVFDTVPKDHDDRKGPLLIPPIGVQKSDGCTFAYNPLIHGR